MLRELYKQYLKISRGVSDRSANHYLTGLNSINTLLTKYHFSISDIFAVCSKEDLDSVEAFLQTNEEFLSKDSVGHNMYSVAFNHYYRFVCDDKSFTSINIVKMDIPTKAVPFIHTDHFQRQRNRIIINQSIAGAHYLCEGHIDHITFTSKATGKPYMEGHHLIPLKYQSDFTNGLDTYANVVCLCPICHRLLHFGVSKEKSMLAEKLFEERQHRLVSTGVDISKNDFLKMVILT